MRLMGVQQWSNLEAVNEKGGFCFCVCQQYFLFLLFLLSPLNYNLKQVFLTHLILSKICLSTCWFQHFIKNKKAWSETLKNPSSQLFPPFLYGLFPHRNRGTLKTWFLFTLLNHTIKWRRFWLCSILSQSNLKMKSLLLLANRAF